MPARPRFEGEGRVRQRDSPGLDISTYPVEGEGVAPEALRGCAGGGGEQGDDRHKGGPDGSECRIPNTNC